MTLSKILERGAVLAVALLGLGGPVEVAQAYQITYQLSFNTTSATNASTPYQMNVSYTGGTFAQPGNFATITNLNGIAATPGLNGLSLNAAPNGTGTNQTSTFTPGQSKFSFDVTFTGSEAQPNPAAGDTSTFYTLFADNSSGALVDGGSNPLFPGLDTFTAAEIGVGFPFQGTGGSAAFNFGNGFTVNALLIPEPSSVVLLAVGLVGLTVYPYLRRRRLARMKVG